MAAEDLILTIPIGLVNLLKALGWAVLFYIAFNIVNVFLKRKRNDELKEINKNLIQIKNLLKKKI